MRKVLVGGSEISGEKTSYFLLVEPMGVLESYGVEIVRGVERDRVAGIALSGDYVLGLAQQLLSLSVTPTTLRDVVNDWVLS